MKRILETIKALNELHQQTFKKQDELKEQLDAYVKENRIFQEGEVVDVFTDRGVFFCKGMVGNAKIMVFSDALSIRHNTKEETLLNNLSDIRYEIFSIKKDGSKSEKHLFSSPHYLPAFNVKYSEYYIK